MSIKISFPLGHGSQVPAGSRANGETPWILVHFNGADSAPSDGACCALELTIDVWKAGLSSLVKAEEA